MSLAGNRAVSDLWGIALVLRFNRSRAARRDIGNVAPYRRVAVESVEHVLVSQAEAIFSIRGLAIET